MSRQTFGINIELMLLKYFSNKTRLRNRHAYVPRPKTAVEFYAEDVASNRLAKASAA